uniref:Uncharacterized protein n=1 Tax=Panagrolaimus superbus TaxID=310955 RepID=A0A914Z151_9BILA
MNLLLMCRLVYKKVMIVVVCYDAQNIVSSLQTGCESNQCMFEAAVSTALGPPILWLMEPGVAKGFTSDICETAVLQSPKAILSFATSTSYETCEPLKRNGNVITLLVTEHGCPLMVKNAKIWYATTPSATTPSESTSTEDSSKIGSIVWIVLGVVLFILIIGLIALGLVLFY